MFVALSFSPVVKRALLASVIGAGLVASGIPASRAAQDWPADIGPPHARRVPLRRLVNHGFTIGYDPSRGSAAWVAYRVTAIPDYSDTMPRPSFEPDPRLGREQMPAVYAGPRYDRGHLAPNYAISRLYGDTAQRETFYYSNIAPQRPRLNQLVWQRLEEIEVDDIAPETKTLWVIAGPVAGARGRPPSAFYRIWLARGDAGRWQVLAFRVPQWVRGDERLDRFLVSVDAIEAATGLDFLTGLADPLENTLEAQPAPASVFHFEEYACQPARYGGRWHSRDGIYLRYDRCDGAGR